MRRVLQSATLIAVAALGLLAAVIAGCGMFAGATGAGPAEGITAVIEPYLQIQNALTRDKADGVRGEAQTIAAQAAKLGSSAEKIRTAAQALEGTFSSEGLVALAGEDANVELALARSLVERMDEGDARRMWSRVFNSREPRVDRKTPAEHKRHLWWEEFESAPDILRRRQRIKATRRTGSGSTAPCGLLF